MNQRLISVAIGCSGLAFLLGVLAGSARYAPPVTCYEDSVIVWTGDAHDHCLPIDDLWLIYPIGE